MNKPLLRIIGDVHGKIPAYLSLAEEAEFSIQLGDLGFNYAELKNLDATRHRVLGGNHDNYEKLGSVFKNQTPHFLGDFGQIDVAKVGKFFFVRGGRSIDSSQRIANEKIWGKTFWPEEELSYVEGLQALDAYEKTKPDFVISHECPVCIIDEVSITNVWFGQELKPSTTAHLLQSMFDYHQPRMWFFGHHHKNFTGMIGSTIFICLPELDYFDFKEVK